MPQDRSCPSPDRLAALLAGRLPDDDSAALADHIEACVACQQAVDRTDTDGPLLHGLRAAADGPRAPALDDMIERLEGLCQSSGFTDASNSDADALNRPETVAATHESHDFLDAPHGPGELGWLGRYQVRELLGAGGMGLVFRAFDPQLQREIALKVLRPTFAQQAKARARFLREARALAAVKHDHIATIFEVAESSSRQLPAAGAQGGTCYLSMELLQGESLADYLQRHPRPDLPVIARIARETAEGLAAAHARGLIHRDVKPANLWLEAEEPSKLAPSPPGHAAACGTSARAATLNGAFKRVKLLDFGLAQPLAEAITERRAIGTPAYMSPEQARGEPLTPACDLFSLGCVLYQMCTGSLPFARCDPPNIFAFPPPRSLADGPAKLPRKLVLLIEQMLALDPTARPSSAHAVAEALGRVERQLHATTSVRRWKIAAVAAVVLAVLTATALFLTSDNDAPVALPEAASTAARLQVAKVAEALEQRNPGFERRSIKVSYDDRGELYGLEFTSDAIVDLSPLRELSQLKRLACYGSTANSGQLVDLSPLSSLELEELLIWANPKLSDLSPLRGMKLRYLDANFNPITSLEDLDVSRLERLSIPNTKVRDLAPLRQASQLKWLSCFNAPIASFDPLASSGLRTLYLSFNADRGDLSALHAMDQLAEINSLPTKDFLRMHVPAKKR